MHAGQFPVLDDEPVRLMVLLLLGNPYQRHPVLGKSCPHNLPAVAVIGGNNASLSGINSFLQVFQPLNGNMLLHAPLLYQLGVAQHLHNHRTELHPGGLDNPLRLLRIRPQAAHYIVNAHPLSLARHPVPGQPAQKIPHTKACIHGKAAGQPAQHLQKPVHLINP